MAKFKPLSTHGRQHVTWLMMYLLTYNLDSVINRLLNNPSYGDILFLVESRSYNAPKRELERRQPSSSNDHVLPTRFYLRNAKKLPYIYEIIKLMYPVMSEAFKTWLGPTGLSAYKHKISYSKKIIELCVEFSNLIDGLPYNLTLLTSACYVSSFYVTRYVSKNTKHDPAHSVFSKKTKQPAGRQQKIITLCSSSQFDRVTKHLPKKGAPTRIPISRQTMGPGLIIPGSTTAES